MEMMLINNRGKEGVWSFSSYISHDLGEQAVVSKIIIFLCASGCIFPHFDAIVLHF